MALLDESTLVIGAGNFYTAAVGTEFDLEALTPWENVGHTPLEDIFSQESDGGDKSVLGSLQNKNLRISYEQRTEQFNLTIEQFDTDSLKLYYGSNAVKDIETGLLQVPASPVPTTCAFMAIFVDNENRFGFYIPKCEILRADDMSLDDTESLAGLPIAISPLQLGSNNWTYAVLPIEPSQS